MKDGAFASVIVTSHIKKEANLHRPDTSEAGRKARSCLCVFDDVTFSASGGDVMLGLLMFLLSATFLTCYARQRYGVTRRRGMHVTNWRHGDVIPREVRTRKGSLCKDVKVCLCFKEAFTDTFSLWGAWTMSSMCFRRH